MGWLPRRETTTIGLEASTICQLKCPICPTTEGLIKQQLGSGFLKFDAFRRIVDENPWVHAIELSNWGDIFTEPGDRAHPRLCVPAERRPVGRGTAPT